MFIRSERLFLRPGWPEDWPELLARIADEAVVKNLAHAPWPFTVSAGGGNAIADRRLPHFFVTLPTSLAPAEIIGAVALHRGDDGIELAQWIARDHWNKGYATEATRAVLGLARTLGHRQIHASHFTDNPAAARVLRKAGFRPTGEVRPRPGIGRTGSAPAVLHAIELDGPCNCEGSDDNLPAMRAA
jgi:RimJ/RimL family protein N-acetyltransferase